MELVKDIDYLGIFLWIVGVVNFLLGISWGGSQYPWKSGAVISTIVIGILAMCIYFFWGRSSDLWLEGPSNAVQSPKQGMR